MALVMQQGVEFGAVGLDVLALPTHLALGGDGQTAQHPQQTSFARAIGALNLKPMS
jgi:hypothetical protein